MKKILTILYAPLFVFSQETTYNHQLEWKSNFLFESNTLDKNFLNTFLYGGYIHDHMKKEWINAGSTKNIIYAEISNGVNYTYQFKNQNIGFSFTDRNILNISASDDLLRITLEGNYNYQNQTLIFDNTNIRADRFQQYKFSYGTEIKGNKINNSISYLKGNHHLSYIIEQGSLYTAPMGTYLDIAYAMNAFITDTSISALTPFANNGNGIALDFSTDFNFKDYDLHLSISDLGFIMWNTSSIKLATDSTFNFQGIEIEDIFSFNDSVLKNNNIIDDILKTNTTSFKSYIPATIHLSFSGKTQYKYLKTYTTGIVTKWQPYMDNKSLSLDKIEQGFQESNFSPLCYINSFFNAKYYDIIPNLSYGGYSADTNIGLALSKGKKNKLIIGTYHLEDIFNGDKAKATSLYLNIKLLF